MDTDDTTVLVFMFMGGGSGLLLMLMVVYYLSSNTGSKYADTDDYIRHTADKPGSYRPKDAMVAVEAGPESPSPDPLYKHQSPPAGGG